MSLLLNARHTSQFHWLQRSLQKSHMQQMVVIYCYMAQSVWHFPHGPINCTGIEYDYHSSGAGILQIWFHFLTLNLLCFLLINQSRRHFVISPAGKMWAIGSGLRKKGWKFKIAHWTMRKCWGILGTPSVFRGKLINISFGHWGMIFMCWVGRLGCSWFIWWRV